LRATERMNRMNEPIRKPAQTPESFQPTEVPLIVNAVTDQANSKYEKYKDIEYYMERESNPESLKMMGVPWQDGFANIGNYHENYEGKLPNAYEPKANIGISLMGESYGNYIFGCRVTTLDDVPEGLVGVDTGYKDFAVITFRSVDTETLVGGEDGPGDGMVTAGDYIKNVWLPAHKHEVDLHNEEEASFSMDMGGKEMGVYMIEVYKNMTESNPEMSFYIPLKANREAGKITNYNP